MVKSLNTEWSIVSTLRNDDIVPTSNLEKANLPWWRITNILYLDLASRQGGFGGVRANTPKDFIYTSKLHILSILPFESGLLVSLLRESPLSKRVWLQLQLRGTRAYALYAVRWKDARVITCVNKSLIQALASCPSSEVTPCTCCSANLNTFSRENSKSAGIVNAYMDS